MYMFAKATQIVQAGFLRIEWLIVLFSSVYRLYAIVASRPDIWTGCMGTLGLW